jgi:hypothetical protein
MVESLDLEGVIGRHARDAAIAPARELVAGGRLPTLRISSELTGRQMPGKSTSCQKRRGGLKRVQTACDNFGKSFKQQTRFLKRTR